MIIKKGDKEYTVTERKENWKLSYRFGRLLLEYTVPKDICKDEAALASYVEREKIF